MSVINDSIIIIATANNSDNKSKIINGTIDHARSAAGHGLQLCLIEALH